MEIPQLFLYQYFFLSDTGIKGVNIFQVRSSSNETIDPLQVMVDQCNEENNFGDAR